VSHPARRIGLVLAGGGRHELLCARVLPDEQGLWTGRVERTPAGIEVLALWGSRELP